MQSGRVHRSTINTTIRISSCNLSNTTAHFTLTLHDALPIFVVAAAVLVLLAGLLASAEAALSSLSKARAEEDRKSTRLNSSHVGISYSFFCLIKKILYIILTNYMLYCNISYSDTHNLFEIIL